MSLPSILVPATVLEQHEAAIRAETRAARESLIATSAERPLRYFLVFSEPGAASRAGLGTLSEVELFYNRYYWFVQFAKLHQADHGFDAGIEDQLAKLLEHAPAGVDWAIVEAMLA